MTTGDPILKDVNRATMKNMPDGASGLVIKGAGPGVDPGYGRVGRDGLEPGLITDPQKADHKSASYTLGAGAETEVASLAGNGLANIIFDGDGDGIFNMRVYSDGVLEDEFPTNWAGMTACAQATLLEIRIHNPTLATATQTSSSFRIRAIGR